MHYVENLIVTEKSTTSITFKKCFLKHDVWASVFTLIDFAIFTENTLYVFKILSIHLAKYPSFISLWSYICSNFQIYNVHFYMLSAKDLTYYPLLLKCCSDLPNITFWYFKLLCNLPQIHLLAMQY